MTIQNQVIEKNARMPFEFYSVIRQAYCTGIASAYGKDSRNFQHRVDDWDGVLHIALLETLIYWNICITTGLILKNACLPFHHYLYIWKMMPKLPLWIHLQANLHTRFEHTEGACTVVQV